MNFARGVAQLVDDKLPNYQTALLDFYDEQTSEGYALGPRSVTNLCLLLHWAKNQKQCPPLPQLLSVLLAICPRKEHTFHHILR